MILQGLKWGIRLILAGIVITIMSACTMLGLNYASLDIANKPVAQPPIDTPFRVAATRQMFEDELYGPWPSDLSFTASSPVMIDPEYMDGRGTLQEIMMTFGSGDPARTFPIVVAIPNVATDTPVPLIISQTFADNCAVFPDSPVTSPDGAACSGSSMTGAVGFLATQIFGRYIAYAPVDRYFDAGFGYASFYGSGFVPDRNGAAQTVMSELPIDVPPSSALMSWAFAFAAVADVLESDPRIRDDALVAAGHSRFGKSALMAAAWSDNIDGAIAHQSGFAGAASNRSPSGETLVRMARSYPHWLRPGLASDLDNGFELSLDQHFLLALAAPKPLLLGNGRRDVWSDPNSTYRMVQAADKIYEAYGVEGLNGTGMRYFAPGDELSYYLRAGGHSVISED
ncbi:MAG: hypothetical protein AAFO63_04270, partial [Pseudomonadota bacterium]